MAKTRLPQEYWVANPQVRIAADGRTAVVRVMSEVGPLRLYMTRRILERLYSQIDHARARVGQRSVPVLETPAAPDDT